MEQSKKSINVEGGNVCEGWIFFFKISTKRDFTFIREMRVAIFMYIQSFRNADNNTNITHQVRQLLATKVGTKIIVHMNYNLITLQGVVLKLVSRLIEFMFNSTLKRLEEVLNCSTKLFARINKNM